MSDTATTKLKEPREGTHTYRTLKYLEKHRGLTSMEAIELFGNTRLSSTIHQLRKMGYNIVSVDRVCRTRYLNETKVSEYRLVKSDDKQGGLF